MMISSLSLKRSSAGGPILKRVQVGVISFYEGFNKYLNAVLKTVNHLFYKYTVWLTKLHFSVFLLSSIIRFEDLLTIFVRRIYYNDYKWLRHCNIIVYKGSITSRDSNHLSHGSHYDVLATTLKTGCS